VAIKLTVFTCVWFLILGQVQAQTLKNPGFETPGQKLVSTSDDPNSKAQIEGTVAEGWMDNSNWADVSLVYSMDTSNPHSGKYAQKIEIKRGFTQFAQGLQLSKGYYRASVWLRAESPLWISVGIRQAGAPYATYASTPAKIGSQWTKVETSGYVPENIPVFLMINSQGLGTFYIDDAEIGTSKARPVTISPPKTPIPKSYFGINVNHMHDYGNIPWPAIPLGGFRTWDSGVVWASIEPAKGTFNWSWLDIDTTEAQKRGVQILLTLGFTPQWASSDPNNKQSPYGALGATAPPADVNDWKDFIRATATRYKGKIHGYEVWNEPDGAYFYSGTPAQLVPLEKATREVLNETDPVALVITPSVSGGGNLACIGWMSDYFTAGGGKYADVTGVHMYSAVPEDVVSGSRLYRIMLASHHMDKKPLWNTETGWGWDGKSTDAEVSACVARAFILNWATGFKRYYWYSWNQYSQVGIRADAQGKFTIVTPAAKAFEQVENWLIGSVMLSCGMNAKGIWTTKLRHPGGSPFWIVWSPNGSQSFSIPASWNVKQCRDLTGKVTAPGNNRTIPVGEAPVLLMPVNAR